jgi:N6-L-threonylcarbamoyladenine synthase
LPLIGVNHVEGHIHAVVLEHRELNHDIPFPALALVVSGGHTHLFEIASPGRYRLLGKTRDDAAGEAYDKVAKLLGYGYPGGPILDRIAPHGNPRGVKFTLARMKGNQLDFSFSGLKTAVLRWVEQHNLSNEIAGRRQLLKHNPRPSVDEWLAVTPDATRDLIASFQSTVIEELLRRIISSADELGASSVIISGGVACNSGLRERAAFFGGYRFYFPSLALSTDNAAMIAAAAFPKFQRSEFAGSDLRAKANLTLAG